MTTLNQRINKGPVDAITCKALYTLNEDWLLWQVSEFKTVVCLPVCVLSKHGQLQCFLFFWEAKLRLLDTKVMVKYPDNKTLIADKVS